MLEKLKYLRKRDGISQQQLADVIGVTQQSINKYENHNIEPDISTLIAIADYFRTSVDFLIGHTEEERIIEVVHPHDLNADESRFIESYRKLTAKQKDSIRLVMETYLSK